MKVYVYYRSFQYEGDEIEAVYSDKGIAMNRAKADAEKVFSSPWRPVDNSLQIIDIGNGYAVDDIAFLVREMEVQGS